MMNQIIRQFAVLTPLAEPRPIKVGLINESYLLPALNHGDPSFFLQRINHRVFPNVEALHRNIALVTDHIRRKLTERGESDIDRKVLSLVPCRNGNLYFKSDDGNYWRMYRYIADTLTFSRITPHSAELAGEAFGDFQTLLSDLPFNSLVESIPHFHDMEFRLRQLQTAVEADLSGRVGAQSALLHDILRRAETMCLAERLHREGRLPKRINHCDTKVNNILFSPDGSVLCIVDLDTVMPGYVLSDFGDFMRTAACTAPEDEPDLERIAVDMGIFAAYTRGYLRKASFLTPLEVELLPFGCRLLSYMQAVRFFTDYLNGDSYYHVDYPDHNLVRTRAQMRLLEEQERHEPEMRAIVEQAMADRAKDQH